MKHFCPDKKLRLIREELPCIKFPENGCRFKYCKIGIINKSVNKIENKTKINN